MSILGLRTLVIRLDDLAGALTAKMAWLCLPLALLLFLQWPLRDLVHHGSREANDAGQILFAFFIAAAVTAATRNRSHLSADSLALGYPRRWRSMLALIGAGIAVLPWALFVAAASLPSTVRSIWALERFVDTFNPGYFLIRCAVVLLAVVMGLRAIREVLDPPELER